MSKSILFYILVILLSSCSKKVKQVEYYTLLDFPDSVHLESSFIPLDYTEAGSKYYLLRDSLVFITYDRDTGNLIEVRSMITNKSIVGALRKGSDSNQFVMANAILPDMNDASVLYLTDPYTNSFSIVNIDSLLQLKDHYKFSKNFAPPIGRINGLSHVLKSEYLLPHLFYYDHPKFNNDVDMLIRFDKSKYFYHNSRGFKGKYKYMVANVNGCKTMINLSKKIVWCYYKSLDRVDLFSLDNLKLVRTLIGPYRYKQNLKVNTEEGEITSITDHGFHLAFLAGTNTKTNVYLLFTLENFDSFMELKANEDRYEFKSQIFKFDWDGKLLKRYLLDADATTISIDSKEQNFYCTVRKKNKDIPKLAKYKIK